MAFNLTKPEGVRDRLEEMKASPEMWALTKEGFVMQVLVLLEILGIDGRDDILPPSADMNMRENLTVEFAHEIVKNAFDLMPPL